MACSRLALAMSVSVSLVPCLAAADEQPARSGPVPLFEGLGGLTRAVTTASPEAQRYFDQGLAFLYAFNHDESIRSFRRATELDPECAMSWWGLAIANGPHINNPVVPEERAREAWRAVERARSLAGKATPVEQALIAAAARRYADPPPAERASLDQAYAEAMRGVWKSYPKDADVGALFAEALADLRPWDLWTADGKPQPGTEELVRALEDVMAVDPRHPLALHMYIHAVEASPEPGRADTAADSLRDRQPGLGHLVHMPSHIDVRRGRWQHAVVANARAMDADRRYRALSPEQGFYRLYMAHNHHMLAYGAMMTGQSELALRTMRQMVADIPPAFLEKNAFADGFVAMPLEVMLRFGRWDEVLAEPEYPAYTPISRALRSYARAIAFAVKGDHEAATREQATFVEARRRVPEEATFGNNKASDLLELAATFMRGELLFLSGQREQGLAALHAAAELEDRLRYDEPPDWIQPVRHALGAALLQSGRFPEAEAVFRKDLEKLPGNGWGLYGLSRALQMQKKTSEAATVEKQFDAVWRDADVRIKSACLCLPGI